MFNLTRRKSTEQPLDEYSEKKVSGVIRRTQEEHDYNSIIALRLKNIRLSKGITQAEVANTIGKSIQQYQKYENGENSLTLYTTNTICNILGITIHDLLNDQSLSEPVVLDNETNGREVMALIRNYTSIDNPDFKKMVMKMALNFSKQSAPKVPAGNEQEIQETV